MKNENGKRKNYIFYSYDSMIYVSDVHPIEDYKKIDKLPLGYYNTSNREVTNGRYGGKNRWSVQNVVKKWEKDIYSAVRMELSALQMKYREFLRMQKMHICPK